MSIDEELKKLENNINNDKKEKEEKNSKIPLNSSGLMERDEKQGKKQGNNEIGKGKPPAEHQFKQGQSGNPNGRPKGKRNFRTIFDESVKMAKEEAKKKGQDLGDVEVRLVKRAVIEALKGNYKHFSYLMDRLHGKAKQSIEHSSEDVEPIQMDIRISELLKKAYDSEKPRN